MSTVLNAPLVFLDPAAGLSQLGESPGLYDFALQQFAAMLEEAQAALAAPANGNDDELRASLLRLQRLAATLGAAPLQRQLQSAPLPAGGMERASTLRLMRATGADIASWQGAHAGAEPVANLTPGIAGGADAVPPTVLVIDDQPAVIHAIRAILKDGFQVCMATGGLRGLDVFRRCMPDLVLLDIDMPHLNGLEVACALRALPGGADVPIIFVTAHESPDEEAACWAAGAVDFISKPIVPQALRSRVRAHCLLKRQSDLLRRLAYLDALTGMNNRRSFEQQLQGECRRAQRAQTPLSLLLVDVDYFKRFNDRYGHPAGDECLRQVAQAFARAISRPGDFAARIGGEEFAVLLPATDEQGASLIAQRINAEVRRLGIAHEDSDTAAHVTVSVGGISVYDPAPDGGSMLSLADLYLYQAKQAGRDRYCAGVSRNQVVADTPPQESDPVAGYCQLIET